MSRAAFKRRLQIQKCATYFAITEQQYLFNCNKYKGLQINQQLSCEFDGAYYSLDIEQYGFV